MEAVFIIDSGTEVYGMWAFGDESWDCLGMVLKQANGEWTERIRFTYYETGKVNVYEKTGPDPEELFQNALRKAHQGVLAEKAMSSDCTASVAWIRVEDQSVEGIIRALAELGTVVEGDDCVDGHVTWYNDPPAES